MQSFKELLNYLKSLEKEYKSAKIKMTPEKFNYCLDKLRSGDISYIADIYAEYYKKMIFTAYSKTKDLMAAEDIASSLMHSLIVNPNAIKGYINNPESWIYRSITNQALNYIKHEKRALPISEVSEKLLSYNVDYELNILITDSIATLNGNEKELFILRYLFDLKLSQIAKILNLPLGTIKRSVHTIKQKLIKLKKYL